MIPRRLLFDWLPVAFVGAANFVLSTDKFRGEKTLSLCGRVARFCHLHCSPETMEWLNGLARKTGHFAGYAILALVLFRAIRLPGTPWRMAAVAFLAALWCGLDEFHQSFTLYRQASLRDASVDFAGSLAALLAVCVVYGLRRRVSAAHAEGWTPLSERTQ